jgi:D-alanyl-D-alanine carboxypeptidase
LPPAPPADQRTVVASAEPTPAPAPAEPKPVPVAAATPPEPAPIATAKPEPVKPEPAVAPMKVEITPKSEASKPETSKPEAPKAEAPKREITAAPVASASAHAHSGWLIQIGAFDGENEARQHLSDAQLKVRTALAAADPFTERVQKGDKALYRARFAGFDKDTATAACRQLKRSDFECMALKD